MSNISAILAERQTTHGEYAEHARCTQAILRAMEAEKNWATLPDMIKESLHMWAHKMGRIATGNPYVKDHYDDVAGYATLVSERLVDKIGIDPRYFGEGPLPRETTPINEPNIQPLSISQEQIGHDLDELMPGWRWPITLVDTRIVPRYNNRKDVFDKLAHRWNVNHVDAQEIVHKYAKICHEHIDDELQHISNTNAVLGS